MTKMSCQHWTTHGLVDGTREWERRPEERRPEERREYQYWYTTSTNTCTSTVVRLNTFDCSTTVLCTVYNMFMTITVYMYSC